jgi:hypothetical protein
MARTAVVAGTATAVAGGVNRRSNARHQASADQDMANQAALDSQAQLADMQAQLDAMQPAAPAPAAAAPAAAVSAGDDLVSQLQKLADLKAAGVLDDADFAAAKAKVLAG